MSIGAQLLRRRVPQILGLYLGASWIAVEFTNLIVGRYLLSDTWIDIVLVSLLALLPTVIMLAWNHGAPGRDGWRKREAIGIGLNLVVAAAFIVVAFGGASLGAAAYTVETVDEEGNTVVREVPKAAFYSTIHLFFPTPDEAIGDRSWLAYAAPIMISTALEQDPFVRVGTLYDQGAEGLIWRAQRAGYQDGLDLPVGLMREIASESRLEHFVSGDLAFADDQYSLRLQVYRTDPLKRVKEGRVTAGNAYQLMQEAADFIKKNLDVQQAGTRVADEFPIGELLSPDIDALRDFIEGMRLMLLANDPQGATDAYSRAVAADGSFARAHLALANARLDAGDFEGGRAAVRRALASSFRLPKNQQYSARAVAYALDQDFERERALYEMWSRLEPMDTEPLNRLAQKLTFEFDQPAEARPYLEASYAIDPAQDWLLILLAKVNVATGRSQEAREILAGAIRKRPDSYVPLVTLADMEIRQGNLDAAYEHLNESALLRSDMVTPQTRLADLELRRGKVEASRRTLDSAIDVWRAPRQTALILEEKVILERTLGRPGAAIELLPQIFELQSRFLDSVDNVIDVWLLNMDLYGVAGRVSEGEAKLADIAETLTGPLRGIVDIGYLKLQLGAGNADAAAAKLAPVAGLIEAFNAGGMRYALRLTEAAIRLHQGNPDGAAEAARAALDTYDASTSSAAPMDDYYAIVGLLGAALREAGEPEQAIQVIQKALAEWPWHPVLNLSLAITLRDLGRDDEARTALQKVNVIWADAEPDYEPLGVARRLNEALGLDAELVGLR